MRCIVALHFTRRIAKGVGENASNESRIHDSDADDVTSDNVLSQIETTYDGNGNVLLTTSRERFHDETGTGALGTPSTGVKARVSYQAAYYVKGDRMTDSVNVGTNGGSSYTRPGTVPTRMFFRSLTHRGILQRYERNRSCSAEQTAANPSHINTRMLP